MFRIWKPVFEDYTHKRNVVVSGCCAPSLGMPVNHLRKLLTYIAKDEDEVDQGLMFLTSEPTQRRVQMLRSASAPRLSRRVIEMVSTKADLDGDGWILYQVC